MDNQYDKLFNEISEMSYGDLNLGDKLICVFDASNNNMFRNNIIELTGNSSDIAMILELWDIRITDKQGNTFDDCVSLHDPLITTVKQRYKDHRFRRCHLPVSCFIPIKMLPMSEDNFFATLSGDFNGTIKEYKKAFVEWKKEN